MPKSKFDFPWPLQNSTLDVSLFAAYITEPCGFAFQCLYDNVNGFADYFVQYWSIIASRFSGNNAILGYELLNEPWAGDIYANPLLLLPGFAGHFNLMKLYDKTHESIRLYDSDTLIFYEPVTWGVLLNENYFGTGFLRPPGNDKQKTVFSWHYYCWLLQFAKNPLVNGTYPYFEKTFCDNVQLEASFQSVKIDLLTLGSGPSFLSEFGVCSFFRDDGTLNTDECKEILNMSDKYFQSWTYWDSRFYTDDGQKVIDDIVDIFSRVYPKATNGIPQFLNFNTSTKYFVYIFELNITSVEQAYYPTELFIPQHAYPNGFKVTIGIHYKWSYESEENILYINLSDDVINQFQLNKTYGFFHKCKVSIFPLND
jgi:endoglycosylceramidase